MQVIIFQNMCIIGRPGKKNKKKNVCILSPHRATSELYAKVPSHRAAVGALCEGSMRIELRLELYAALQSMHPQWLAFIFFFFFILFLFFF